MTEQDKKTETGINEPTLSVGAEFVPKWTLHVTLGGERKSFDLDKIPGTFAYVTKKNKDRSESWHGDDARPWTLADWSNALAGEAGEAIEAAMDLVMMYVGLGQKTGKLADAVKKYRRLETGVSQSKGPQSMADALEAIKKEIADVYLYLDLTCTHLGIDIYSVVKDKYNEVSKREGFREYWMS